MAQESVAFAVREPIPLPTCDAVAVVVPKIPPAPREEAELGIDWEVGLVNGEVGAFIDHEHDITVLPPSIGEVGWKRPPHIHDKNTAFEEAPALEGEAPDAWKPGAPLADQFPDWHTETEEKRTVWVADPESEVHSRKVSMACNDSLPVYTQWLTAIFHLVGTHSKFLERCLWELIHPQMEADGKILPIVNPSGKYVVTLFLGGMWRQVMIDDRIPCQVNQSHASVLPSSTTRSLWPSILGKAVLKSLPMQQDFAVVTALTGWLPKISPLTWPALRTQFNHDVFLTVVMDTLKEGKKKKFSVPWIIAELDEFEGDSNSTPPFQSWKQVRLQALNWRPAGSLNEKKKEVVEDEDEDDENRSDDSRDEAASRTSHAHTIAANTEISDSASSSIASFHKALGPHGWWMLHENLPSTICSASSSTDFTVASNDQWRKTDEVFPQPQPKLLHIKVERPPPPEEQSDSADFTVTPSQANATPKTKRMSMDDSSSICSDSPMEVRVVFTYTPRQLYPDTATTSPGCYVVDVCEWFGTKKKIESAVSLKPEAHVVSTELALAEGEYWFLVLESPNVAGSILSCFLQKKGVSSIEFLDIPDTLQGFDIPVLSIGAPEKFADASAIDYNVWVKTLVTVESPSVTMMGYLSDPKVQRHVRITWLRLSQLKDDAREDFPFAKPQTLAKVIYRGAFLPMVKLPVSDGTQYLLLVEAILPDPMRQPDWNCLLFGSKGGTLAGETLSSEIAQRWEGNLVVNERNKDLVLRERIIAKEGDTTCTLRMSLSLDSAYLIAKIYVQHPAVKDAEGDDAPQPAGDATDHATYGGRHRWLACLEEIDRVEGRASITFPHIVFAGEVVYILEVTADPYKGEPVSESNWVLQSFGDKSLEVGADKIEMQLEAAACALWGNDEEAKQQAAKARRHWIDEGRAWEWEQMNIKELTYLDEHFTDEIKNVLAHCREAPDPNIEVVDEAYNGDYVVVPLTEKVIESRLAEEEALRTQTAELWESYTTSADEQLKQNAETMAKIIETQNSYSWFRQSCSDERENLRTFISSRVEKQEALTTALIEAEFDAEAILEAVQVALDHKLDVINAALIDRARRRVLLSEKVQAVQGDVTALKEEQANGAQIVERLDAAKVELDEVTAEMTELAEKAKELADAEEQRRKEAQEAKEAKEQEEAEKAKEEGAEENAPAEEAEPEIDEEELQRQKEAREAQEAVDAKAGEVAAKDEAMKAVEAEVAEFRAKEKKMKDDIGQKHEEADGIMKRLMTEEVPVANSVTELEEVMAAISDAPEE